MTSTPRRAVIYTRVSRDDESKRATPGEAGEKRGSNDSQRESCEHLAKAHGWTVVAVEEDVSISAYSGKSRPGWKRVLDLVDAGDIDIVLAWHMDRMTRSMTELEELIIIAEKHGVGVVTVEGDINLTTEMGRMVARILTAVARAEVERKGERQRRANKQRAAEGQPWMGGWRALGYESEGVGKDKKMVVVEREAEHIRAAAEDVLNGTALHEIRRRWAAAELRTPRSQQGRTRAWTHSGVRSVLLNPRYAGIATYKGEVLGTGDWSPILTPEVHTLLVAKLKDPLRRVGGAANFGTPDNLLSGIAKCAVCAEPVHSGSGHKGVPIYQCKKYHQSTYREEADAIVRTAFAFTIAAVGPGQVIPLAKTATPQALLHDIENINGRLTILSSSFAAGNITIEQLESGTKLLRQQQAEAEEQVRIAQGAATDPNDLRSEAVRGFLDLGLQRQREVLSELAEIVLYPKGRGRKRVPIQHQVTVRVKNQRGQWVVALDERPPFVGRVPEDSSPSASPD